MGCLWATCVWSWQDSWICLKKDDFKFLWVTEFPLLEYSEEQGPLMWPCIIHLPCPWTKIWHLIDSDPGAVRAKAYDIVLNGTEIGGGSVRIHQSDIQSKMFEVLGFTPETGTGAVRLPA